MVEVEAHLAPSLPAFTLVGLPDASLAESRDRVRAAVTSSGLAWPNRRITVNLSPATLPKSGSGFDLAIAVATLAGAEAIDPAAPRGVVHLGELGLDGRLRPVRGVLPAVAAAVAAGWCRVVVAGGQRGGGAARARCAGRRGDEPGRGRGGLRRGRRRPRGRAGGPGGRAAAARAARRWTWRTSSVRTTRGRASRSPPPAGTTCCMVGPPGTGKTMLAARLPGLLPDLSEADAVEVTAVHSVAGAFDPGDGLLRRPPFEDPHHTATPASVVGGGSGVPRPGAASRAHRGVLFLDEAPEFSTAVLQTLRQPLEHGELVLHRAAGTARYPARFQLVLAANPCPCGQAVGKGLDCTCRSEQRRRYFGKLSGPLLDRVDLQVELSPGAGGRRARGSPRPSSPRGCSPHGPRRRTGSPGRRGAPTATSRAAGCGSGWDPIAPLVADLDRALDRGTLSLRGVDRVLRVAWTLADLAGRAAPGRADVGHALLLRTRGNGA